MAGLVSDLASKASVAALSAVNANLVQAIVTSLTTLEEALDAKASTQELSAAIATQQAAIAEGSLSQSKVTNLVADLASKVSSSTFSEANQQRINADALLEESILNLNNGLAGKQPLIADGGLAQSRSSISPATLRQRPARNS